MSKLHTTIFQRIFVKKEVFHEQDLFVGIRFWSKVNKDPRPVSIGKPLPWWEEQGEGVVKCGDVELASDTNWHIQAVGDFNGDDLADILWRHTVYRTVCLWSMNGTSISSHGAADTVSDLNWQMSNCRHPAFCHRTCYALPFP